MRTVLAISMLMLAVALVPHAEARQVCVYGDSNPCDDHLACVWNRLKNDWTCFGETPCDPTSCDPYWGTLP